MAKFSQILSVFIVFTTCLLLSQGEVIIQPNVKELYVKDGASQELNCTTEAVASDKPEIRWSEMPSYSGVTRKTETFDLGDGKILIESKLAVDRFESQHAGVYTCKYDDNTITMTSEIDLIHVKETKIEPAFFTGNASATLGCTVDVGDRKVENVEWLKAGEPVSGSRFAKNSDNNLVITNPVREDIGIYIARFTLNGAAIPYDCEVAYKEEKLQIIPKKTESEYFYLNQTGILACSLNVPASRIKSMEWLKNGTSVSKLKEPTRFQVQEDNYTLIIDKPTRDDVGMYTARFVIEGIPEPYDCEVMYKSEPFVLDFEKSKNLIQEDNMELQCKVKGYPKAVVRWYKGNQPLNESVGEDRRIELKPLNGYENARLFIRNVGFSDEGQYTCEAYSAYFGVSAKKTITVRVKDKLAALWPFLGIVGEVVFLCFLIFCYERHRNKRAEQEDNATQEIKNGEKHSGVRHRGSKK